MTISPSPQESAMMQEVTGEFARALWNLYPGVMRDIPAAAIDGGASVLVALFSGTLQALLDAQTGMPRDTTERFLAGACIQSAMRIIYRPLAGPIPPTQQN